MAEPLSPRAAAQAACPHADTYEAIESVSQRLTTRCDDCGKNLTKPETGTVWDELARLRAEVAELRKVNAQLTEHGRVLLADLSAAREAVRYNCQPAPRNAVDTLIPEDVRRNLDQQEADRRG